MSYIYLQEQGAEYLAECFSDIPASVLSKSNLIPVASCSKDSATESCQSFQSGMTCEHSTEHRGEGAWTWFAGAFPVPIFHKSNREQKESTGEKAGYGQKWRELSMKCDLETYSLKTHRSLFAEDLDGSCATFPEWGMMHDGEFWAHATPGLVIFGTDFGYWATPNSRDWRDSVNQSKVRKDGRLKIDQTSRQVFASLDGSQLFTPPTASRTWMEIFASVQHVGQNMLNASAPDQQWTNRSTIKLEAGKNTQSLEIGGVLNAEFPEWLLGWPIGWTESKPLETDKFRQWLLSHGARLEDQTREQ